MWHGIKTWARRVKRDIVALYIAARDPRTPWCAKAVAFAVAAYALSPIDLIPDFIPVFGYLDDLFLLPIGIVLAIRLIPPQLMIEFRRAAESRTRPRSGWFAAAVVIAVWIVVAVAVLSWAYHRSI